MYTYRHENENHAACRLHGFRRPHCERGLFRDELRRALVREPGPARAGAPRRRGPARDVARPRPVGRLPRPRRGGERGVREHPGLQGRRAGRRDGRRHERLHGAPRLRRRRPRRGAARRGPRGGGRRRRQRRPLGGRALPVRRQPLDRPHGPGGGGLQRARAGFRLRLQHGGDGRLGERDVGRPHGPGGGMDVRAERLHAGT